MSQVVTQPAVCFTGVCKTWGQVRANDHVSFTVQPGTLHALIGENGAGKSTAMNMLFGLEQHDSGTISVNGHTLNHHSPEAAKKLGIGMVHQHFLLAEPYSSLENIALALRDRYSPWRPLPWKKLREELNITAQQIGLTALDWDAPIATLPVATQQKIEILKCLLGHSRIMILDEPTAVLTPQESDELFAMLSRLKEQGTTIILITHKLREVLGHSDHVTVLRRGRVVMSVPTKDTSATQLGAALVGDQLPPPITHVVPRTEKSYPVITLRDVTIKPQNGRPWLDNISLQVMPHEIVGIAGVQGSGQHRLVQLLKDPRSYFHHAQHTTVSGTYHFDGIEAQHLSTEKLLRQGLAVIAEDRHQDGLLLDRPMTENFLLGHLTQGLFQNHGLIKRAQLLEATETAIRDFNVRPPLPHAIADSFSGGNQQKLLIARALYHRPKFLIASEPTRGVDIGAIAQIHRTLENVRQETPLGILLISSDLDELMALSDRLYVMYCGRFVKEFTRDSFDERTIGFWMGGGHQDVH